MFHLCQPQQSIAFLSLEVHLKGHDSKTPSLNEMVLLPLLNFCNILLFLSNTFLRGMIFQTQTLLSSLMLDSKLLTSKACVFSSHCRRGQHSAWWNICPHWKQEATFRGLELSVCNYLDINESKKSQGPYRACAILWHGTSSNHRMKV